MTFRALYGSYTFADFGRCRAERLTFVGERLTCYTRNSTGPGHLRRQRTEALGYEASPYAWDSDCRCPDRRRRRRPLPLAASCFGNVRATPTTRTFPICQGGLCPALSLSKRLMVRGPGLCGIQVTRLSWPVMGPPARPGRRCIWRARRRNRSRVSLCHSYGNRGSAWDGSVSFADRLRQEDQGGSGGLSVLDRMISWSHDKTQVGPMDSESHPDFLIMVIFVLGSICFSRWLYIEQPAPVAENPPAHSDVWTSPPLE